MTQILLTLPDTYTPAEASMRLAVRLFESHEASLGKAAEIAGVTKAEFMTRVGDYGVPIFDYEPGEIEQELHDLRKAKESS